MRASLYIVLVSLVLIFLFYCLGNRELFLSKEVMVEQNLLEKTPPIKLFPYYILDKQQRKITDKYIQDHSGILSVPYENKVLRDVDELMNSETHSDNIYDATSVGNKKYYSCLDFW